MDKIESQETSSNAVLSLSHHSAFTVTRHTATATVQYHAARSSSSYARYSPDPRSPLSDIDPTPTSKTQPPLKFPTKHLISARCGDPPRPIGHVEAGIPNRACLGEMTMHERTAPRRVRSLSLSALPELVCTRDRLEKKPRSLDSADLVPETGENGRTITTFRVSEWAGHANFLQTDECLEGWRLERLWVGRCCVMESVGSFGCRIADAFLSLWRHSG